MVPFLIVTVEAGGVEKVEKGTLGTDLLLLNKQKKEYNKVKYIQKECIPFLPELYTVNLGLANIKYKN
jgi:hypothetical protein